jgi:hypothetical protein
VHKCTGGDKDISTAPWLQEESTSQWMAEQDRLNAEAAAEAAAKAAKAKELSNYGCYSTSLTPPNQSTSSAVPPAASVAPSSAAPGSSYGSYATPAASTAPAADASSSYGSYGSYGAYGLPSTSPGPVTTSAPTTSAFAPSSAKVAFNPESGSFDLMDVASSSPGASVPNATSNTGGKGSSGKGGGLSGTPKIAMVNGAFQTAGVDYSSLADKAFKDGQRIKAGADGAKIAAKAGLPRRNNLGSSPNPVASGLPMNPIRGAGPTALSASGIQLPTLAAQALADGARIRESANAANMQSSQAKGIAAVLPASASLAAKALADGARIAES